MQTRKELYELLDYDPARKLAGNVQRPTSNVQRRTQTFTRPYWTLALTFTFDVIRRGEPMSTETKPAYSPGLAGVVAGRNSDLLGRSERRPDVSRLRHSRDGGAGELRGGRVSAAERRTAERAAAAGFRHARSRRNASCRTPVLEMLRLLPKKMHPMDVLRTGVSMLAPFDPDLNDHSHEANVRKAIRLIARVSTLITDGWRISQGQDPIADNPDLTHAGNFLYKLTGEVPRTGRCGCSTRSSFFTPITNSTRRPSPRASPLRRWRTCMRR